MTHAIPCVLMRGGTSRGPFFRADWLPDDPDCRNRLLLAAMGSPHALQVDGLGGGHTLTSKVAIVSPSRQPDCDIDYLFCQVSVERAAVDMRPNCGNMLSAAAPFAIEQGLVQASDGQTVVRVYNVNTGARIHVVVQTPGGAVTYDGDTRIDGVPGQAAPVQLRFLDAWGTVTGSLFPTGQRQDLINGVPVTCIDAAMPMVLLPAHAFELVGSEPAATLDAWPGLLPRLEEIRQAAGHRMGLGDVSDSVIPKPVLVASGPSPHSIHSRYFTPHQCHRAHAATGAVGVAAACVLPGTVAHALAAIEGDGAHHIDILHPSGSLRIDIATTAHGDIEHAALVRTARKIMAGALFLPPSLIMPGETA